MNARDNMHRTESCTEGGSAKTSERFGVVTAQGGWRKVTWGVVAGVAAVATAGSLMVPSAAIAADWVNVGGNQYNAGTAAGDDAGTWNWDGADDMKLNGYNGGAIKAAGKLNVAYEGKNTVKTDPDSAGAAIKAENGASQKAELNITSSKSLDELNVTAEADAIKSSGDLSISGPGTVNTTSTRSDGIEAKGDLSITGSGTVNATGGTEGIQSGGNATIDSSGTVIAKGERRGIAAGSDLIIKGGGKAEASSAEDEAIRAEGNIEISGGSQVKASSKEDLAVDTEGRLTVTNASLNASGVEYGVYGCKGITLDHATVTVRASAGGGWQTIALITDEDDIVIKNGSIVDALAEGGFSAAIASRNYNPGESGGHIYISDSVVNAIARYAETGGDGPDHYSEGQDGEAIPEREGLNIGIFAQTSEGITPATISIVRSKVTAEGDTAAIFALAMSADGKAIGTIEIEGATILTPEGGKVIDYRNKEELSDGISYEAGQTIGTGDVVVDSPYDEAVAKSAVIAPPEETKPEANPEETTPVVKPAKQQTLVTGAKAEPAEAKKNLPATGDASPVGFAATAFAGVAAAFASLAALLAGFVARRKRE